VPEVLHFSFKGLDLHARSGGGGDIHPRVETVERAALLASAQSGPAGVPPVEAEHLQRSIHEYIRDV